MAKIISVSGITQKELRYINRISKKKNIDRSKAVREIIRAAIRERWLS